MNKAILMGRITKDPELKTTQSQIPVCSFTLAIDRRVKEGANKVTDFINCVAWRGTAEFLAKYFRKGQRVLVTGSLQVREWEKDGVKRQATEVLVDELEFIEPKAEGRAEAPKPATVEPDPTALPFDL